MADGGAGILASGAKGSEGLRWQEGEIKVSASNSSAWGASNGGGERRGEQGTTAMAAHDVFADGAERKREKKEFSHSGGRDGIKGLRVVEKGFS
ncbi:hypothetical protein E2562_013223 [Oryza meyeriana var. granulata]|uniref:Uncharacterized protein n=1 Tax=Oryza meyeriana var. granulata TaxID=110450 RepID=A0A6G1D1Q3_9ORYZ|nr:hypothetical protein E2562_013223 [Oryza meyeriana var. granulata]